METHDEDPRENASDDPWQQAGERWARVSEKIRDRYREMVGDDGPDEDTVRDALKTLGGAAQAAIDSLGEAMRDPEVRTQVKDATASFVSALGETFSQLGSELRRPRFTDEEE